MSTNSQVQERRVYYRYEEINEALAADELVILPTDRSGDSLAESYRTDAVVDRKQGFWRRQFGPNVTAKQHIFDWTMGVIMPVICFCFDPIVFKSHHGVRDTLFGNFSVFANSLAFVSVIALAGWLLLDTKLRWLNGLFAGLFFAGSFVSLGLGIALFPFSVLGISVFIGFLGFTPLFSTIVYSRNAVRAMRASEPYFEKPTLHYVAMLAGLFGLVLPWLLNQSFKLWK